MKIMGEEVVRKLSHDAFYPDAMINARKERQTVTNMKLDKVKRMRFIDKVCRRCKTIRIYYEDFQGSRADFLETEGWKKIKGCWVCDECAAEEDL